MKLIEKILTFFIILTIALNTFSILSYTVNATTYSEMMDQAAEFINKGKTQTESSGFDISDVTKEFVGIGQILTMIGTGVLIAVATYMGIKYITSGPDAQAKLKQQLIGVVVSAIVIFGAYGIWKLVGQIAQSFE